MGAQAVALYKQILDEDPSSSAPSTRSRSRPSATRTSRPSPRCSSAASDRPDAAARLVIVLQKLGGIYADRLHDHGQGRRAPGAASSRSRPGTPRRCASSATATSRSATTTGSRSSTRRQRLGRARRGPLGRRRQDDGSRAQGRSVLPRARASTTSSSNAPERAFRAYERVLSVTPDDARAAAALVPLYEKDEKWARLPALYEVLLGHARDTEDKLALLDKLVHVTGMQLQDRAAAFAWARKAFELAPATARAPSPRSRPRRAPPASGADSSRRSTRGSRRSRGRARPARRRRSATRTGLRPRGAKSSASCARSSPRCTRASWAGSTRPSRRTASSSRRTRPTSVAVQTLDRVLREADRKDDLRWLFDLRVERANTALKLDLLAEWAMLEEEAFAAPESAIATLPADARARAAPRERAALARPPPARPGDADGAAEVIARDRDQREGTERAAPRDRARASSTSTRFAGTVDALGARARARARAERSARDRGRRGAARGRRDARARGGDPRARVRRDGRRAAAGRRPRGAHRDDGRAATIGSPSTVASPT